MSQGESLQVEGGRRTDAYSINVARLFKRAAEAAEITIIAVGSSQTQISTNISAIFPALLSV